ncbi:MAG: putative siderophore-binding lipoprotein YfiY [Paracidovorax wautersii]|uniref:Putative siderophore-binding lipoprotein YfiY n=1 Tax=Paracidovorax wautersii TaxID=1177982 RepID=A0A7V8FRI2_9BURK|nr:MAG: putative siderophore-binding lipoprotein YfiY [Paracidovorax wautersii]
MRWTSEPWPLPPADQTRRRTLAACAAGLALAALPPAARAQAGSRQIRHAMGTTTLTGSPSRPACLFQGASDTAAALGLRPAGIVESWTDKPVYSYLRPALSGVPLLGLETQPSLETLVHLRPDLIVGSRFRHERIHGLLSRIAPTVMLDDIFDFRQTLLLMGQAMDLAPRAGGLLARWDARTQALRGALQHRTAPHGGWTVSVVEAREDHIRLYLPTSFPGRVLQELGFARTPLQADTGRPLYKLASRESIPLLEADLMFVLMRSQRPEVRRSLARWSQHRLWAGLTAVRNGRVFEVDGTAWNLGGGILAAGQVLADVARAMGLALPAQEA